MKKLAIISSHCDTQDKLEILNKNINLLKSLGVDTMVISTIKTDIDADYLFITKENPVLKWPERCIVAWKLLLYDERKLRLSAAVEDYGWASLYQIKKIMEIAITYDYEIFYFLIYDLNIDEKIVSDIQNNYYNLIYPRKDFSTDKIYPSSLHFAIFNKIKLKLFSDLIDKMAYMKIGTGFAEDFVHQCAMTMALDHSEHVVTDVIQMINSERIFNFSPDENYKLFFNKDDNHFKAFFYDNTKLLYLHVNDQTYVIEKNYELIDSSVSCTELKNLKIESSGQTIDYLPTYQKISRNHIYFE